MTRDDIIRMTLEAGWSGLYATYNEPTGKADWQMVKESLTVPVTMEQIERFAALVAAAQREKVAQWMIERSYATGHGDTIEDLLQELEWQVAEREREACALICEEVANKHARVHYPDLESVADECAGAIRARGEK